MGCNLHCKMCPVPDPHNNMNGRKYSGMPFELYRRIIDQLSDKCRTIRLNQLGEPLLNSEIVDFVAYASSKGHHVGFTTNGTKLVASIGKKLILAGLREIVFSFDGCNRETYEKIRSGANYEEVLAHIAEFSRLNIQLNGKCKVGVDCIVSDLTCSELGHIEKFWGQKNIPVNFIPLDDWAGKVKLPEEFGNKRTTTKAKRVRYPCHLLWASMAISSEGRVMYCCHDYKLQSRLPSVMEKPLLAIWNSEIKAIRIRHVKGLIDEDPCLSCNAWMTMPEFYSLRDISLNRVKSKLKALLRK
ncbi:radical SAM/SPASM domain-containing protein [Geotalea sp. SG265]|uniref:radical SAM/SPASM domain-containing protein n=1 Tax=Geotalea sp. SG265 TaxID=2922867 RepID=UPI001FAFB91C|nr:radical SAM/SPASM domain-containing protein [Geotalea sp. SG265]